ncbi:MAG: XRE family transcriptional regulator [Bacteroidales bacterium]|nr:XRE family transcriptional regulator [Bacteroidales bacterium]
MEYRLDIYSRNPDTLMMRLANNCKARRLDKGYSRNTLSKLTSVPAPTIERFERTGKISLESFCRLAIEFDYFEELGCILDKTKYTTSAELERITKNRNRKNGR